MVILIQKDINRFWSHVDIKDTESCWNWTAAKHRQGYGQFSLSGVNGRRKILAHQMAYIISNGPIPEGKFCLHNCDNSSCCNPNHLYIGTQTDNMQDMYKRGYRRIERRHIERDNALFYSGEIWLIRKLKTYNPLGKFEFSPSFVSKMFNTDQNTIWKIWNSDKYMCREGYYC